MSRYRNLTDSWRSNMSARTRLSIQPFKNAFTLSSLTGWTNLYGNLFLTKSGERENLFGETLFLLALIFQTLAS